MSEQQKKFQLYDFSKGEGLKVAAAVLPAIVVEKFLHLMRQSLRHEFHLDAKIEVSEQPLVSVEAWQNEDHTHHAFASFLTHHPKGHIIAEFSDELIGHIVNIAAGGKVKFSTPAPLPLSSINERACKRFCTLLTKDLGAAWVRHKPLELNIQQIEANASYFHFLSRREALLRLNFTMKLDGVASSFALLFPINFLNLFKKEWQHANLRQSSDAPWVKEMTKHVKKTSLHICVQLGEAEITVEELLKLGVGDVIVLDQKTSDPLKVFIEGRHKMDGRAGVAAGHRAVRIIKKAC